MKETQSTNKLTQILFLITLLITVSTVISAQAWADTSDPLDVQISLDTAPVVSLGEPVMIRYRITNISGGKLGVIMGDNKSWYTLTLIDPIGHSANALHDLKPPSMEGARDVKNGYMDVGHVDEDYIIITQQFALLQPGRYKLMVHVAIPYVIGDATAEGSAVEQIAKSGEKFEQDYTVPFTVTQTDPIRLQAKAQTLYDEMGKLRGLPNGIIRWRALANELFSMPEVQAALLWESLAAKPGVNAELIASKLSELHTITATNILVKMLDDPSLPKGVIRFVSHRIATLYNGGDATLREHIQNLAAQRGSVLMDKIEIPQSSD